MPQGSTFPAPLSKTPQLIFIRHGETAANDPHAIRLRGWLPWPLDVRGWAQAQAARDFLEGVPYDQVLHADLLRTEQTAWVLARGKARLVPQQGLKTWNTGILTDQLEKVVEPFIDYFLHHPTIPIPGGESYDAFWQRMMATVSNAAQASIKDRKPLVLVASHSNLLAVPSILQGGSPISAHKGKPGPGGILWCWVSDEGWQIKELEPANGAAPADPE